VAGPADLYDLAAEWLAACELAVASAPGGAIAYAFVAPGSPALDCELLAVWAGGPIEAETAPLSPPLAPGHRDTVQGAVHLVNLTCCVVRCSPVGDDQGRAPSAAEYEAVARQTMGDVWAIWNFTRQRHRDGSLFASGHQREVFLEPAYPLPIQGGLAGWQVPIRVQLDGYPA
jgi:hypothetical protein